MAGAGANINAMTPAEATPIRTEGLTGAGRCGCGSRGDFLDMSNSSLVGAERSWTPNGQTMVDSDDDQERCPTRRRARKVKIEPAPGSAGCKGELGVLTVIVFIELSLIDVHESSICSQSRSTGQSGPHL